jgi:serralysin
VRIHLAEGWAEDGMGGQDTLVNIISATGSQHDDYFWGDLLNNYFYGQGGHDVIDGGAGIDSIGVPGFSDKTGKFRETYLSELIIDVSADGRTAVVQDPTGTGKFFKYDLHDVEFVWGLTDNNEYALLELSSLIQASTVALTTIAAGSDYRWNLNQKLGTATALTFSFMTDSDASTGKRPMSLAEKNAARETMAMVSSFSGLSFTEVQESAQNLGQIRWGVIQQSNSKGYTWLPHAANLIGQAGDIFMDEESMLYLQAGGQGLEAMLHELGHALGLRHPINSAANDQWAQVAAERFNTAQLTVMAQPINSEALARADFGVLDIAALRFLYGVMEVNTGSTVYKLTDSDGQSLKTIVDDGGIDTVDCAALSAGVSLNLVDGKLWDIGLTRDGSQATNNFGTAIGTLLESAIGTAYDDVLIGNALNNQFTPGNGNDWVEGADGLDTVYLAEPKSSYLLNKQEDVLELWSASANTGFKTLMDTERVVFKDSAIAWDLDGNAGQVAQILGAVFGAESVQNTKYAGIGLSLLDIGFSYTQLMGLAIDANLGIGATHAQVINLLYQNLLHVPADANAILYWSTLLNQGAFTHASLAVMAADLDLNKQNINLIGLASSGLEYTPV